MTTSRETRISRRNGLVMSVVVLCLMMVISTVAFFLVGRDKRIPVHWGIDGNPDRYGGRFEAFFLIPLITVGLTLLFALIPAIEPRRRNMAFSMKAYSAIWFSLFMILATVHLLIVSAALGRRVSPNLVVPVAVGVLLVVVGNYMGKMRSNFFMGIRTPWTLSSEVSWNKTHRLGGKLFMLLGVLLMISCFFRKGKETVVVVLGGVVFLTLFLFIYSYLVWKRDVTRQGDGSRSDLQE